MQRTSTKPSERKIIDGRDLKIAIVISKYNDDVTTKLLAGAKEVLKNNDIEANNIHTTWVPGSFEMPLACQKLATANKYNAIIAIGCVIKGDTDHYYYIAGQTAQGIMQVMLNHSIPIGFGVITTDNMKQAHDRAGETVNKGAEAAQAALEMLAAFKG